MATRIVMAPQRAQWPVPLPWSYSLGDKRWESPRAACNKKHRSEAGCWGGLAPSTGGQHGPRPCPHVCLGPGSLLHLSEHSSLTPLSLKTSALCLPVCVCVCVAAPQIPNIYPYIQPPEDSDTLSASRERDSSATSDQLLTLGLNPSWPGIRVM